MTKKKETAARDEVLGGAVSFSPRGPGAQRPCSSWSADGERCECGAPGVEQAARRLRFDFARLGEGGGRPAARAYSPTPERWWATKH